MNDLYIQYRSKLMLVDCLDMPPDVELAHRRLCDLIWALDKAPADDTGVLQSFCRVQPQNWARVRGSLESKGWHTSNGSFTHAGAMKSLSECHESADAKMRQTEAARAAREAKKHVTNTVTDSVTDNVTEDVTTLCNSQQPKPKPKPKPKPILILNRGLEEKSRLANPTFRARDLANRIYGNKDGWSYDNCKVQAEKIEPRSLASVIEKALVSKTTLTDHDVLNAWLDASQTAHGAAVDGLPKARKCPEAYAIACFKSNLNL